ncbi:SDR family NAD(P)-dependent oxidoreductase [Veillonella sp.]
MARNVFVTGATSGIGLCIAEAYAKHGDNVLISGRRVELLDEVQARLSKEHGVRVETLVLDVRSREDVESKVPAAIEAFGGVDVLVNNAGLAQGLDPFQDSTVEDAVTMINTNVLGLLYVTKAVLPFMIDKNEGHIVNMGSTAGIYAYPGGAVYCATKAAVKMLADGIRMDTIATDIKVTTIQPGIVETPFSEVRFHGDAERAASVYAGIDAVQPQDVADVVLYVTNQPKRMQITDVTIMANQQAAGFMVHKK